MGEGMPEVCLKAIMTKDGVRRCESCNQLLAPRDGEDDKQFVKRKYCDKQCKIDEEHYRRAIREGSPYHDT